MTKLERAWMDSISQLGCVICLLFERAPDTPAEPHHLLSGGRRRGHLYTIPLCPLHHRSGVSNDVATSRDQCRPRFEARYGTEESLLLKTRLLVEERFALFIGVDIDAVHYNREALRG